MNLDKERQKLARQFERLLDDPVGIEIVANRLGVNFNPQVHNKELEVKEAQTSVAVLVPSHRELKQNMMDCRWRMLMASKQAGINVFAEPIRGSSVVSWVRNDMVADLYRTGKKFTHVLFLDDDMTFEPDTLIRMLKQDADVLGTLYTVRSDPPKPNVHVMNIKTTDAKRIYRLNSKDVAIDDKGLMSATDPDSTITAGTGVMLIKKEVLDRVSKMYDECEYEKLLYNLTDEQMAPIIKDRKEKGAETGNHYWFQFLPRLCGFGESGEDTSFCLKAALCGFKVRIDSTIQPGHIGEYTYHYDDFLPYLKPENI